MLKKMIMCGLALCLAIPGISLAANIKIGVILPRTGPEAPIGEEMSNGIKMAQEDLKKKGINLEIVWEDDTGKPQIAMSAMEKLATRDGVAGVVGAYNSASTSAVAKVADKYKVPLMIPISSKEELTMQGNKWVYRINSPVSFYATALIDYSLAHANPKSMAIIFENTDFGNSAAKTAKAYAAKKGITVVAEEGYAKGAPDYRSTLTKIKEKKPDLIYMVSYIADAILLMRQARELEVKPQAYLGAGGGFNLAQFANEKLISNYVITSTQWSDDVSWPGAKDFASRYKSRFGLDASHHGACSYESMRILGETAVAAGGDREKVRTGLKNGKWTGLLGDVKFDDFAGYNNQNKHQILVQQIQGGKYETVFPLQYASKKSVYPYPGWK